MEQHNKLNLQEHRQSLGILQTKNNKIKLYASVFVLLFCLFANIAPRIDVMCLQVNADLLRLHQVPLFNCVSNFVGSGFGKKNVMDAKTERMTKVEGITIKKRERE